jgi:3D (Asp-Asp-Asp) domain-containing protein
MPPTEIIQRLAKLSPAVVGALALASCTGTSSNLSALTRQNALGGAATSEVTAATGPTDVVPPAVTAATAAAPAAAPGAGPTPSDQIAPTTTAPAASLGDVSSDQIVGLPAPAPAPAQVDPVAVPKPVASAPPTTLASVPRTPVSNRPTNQIMMVRTTAYTHTESDHVHYGRKSAAGNTLKYGSHVRSAAADWSKYPLGTRFMIEGLPYEYVVDDYGSALVGTETIDIYKPEKGTMNRWGVRNVPIRVLEWGSFEESRKILDERKHVRHADHVREMLHEIEKKGRNGSISLSPTGTNA